MSFSNHNPVDRNVDKNIDKNKEKNVFRVPGLLMVPVFLLLGGLAFVMFASGKFVIPVILGVLIFLSLGGFVILQPNDSRVYTFLGSYVGSLKEAGFHWTNPFSLGKFLSLKVRNFNSEKLKVNDADGNPIEIAAVVVWRVIDTSRAMFDVENYQSFVHLQTEIAIRALATEYSYDDHNDQKVSLRGSPEVVAASLKTQLEKHLLVAGVQVIETRLSHLAYAQEIAGAMLRRQQAQAVIAARQQIVEGAVGMVELALARLSERGVVHLDEERKAAMVNNLLVVLCAEQESQPVINSGSLY